ncbi:Hypothetical predicted protein [Cloeon dipterum]|uniref:C-type lectin domain-containing protein n=1 Tax=Cloeon dipterum TaxID=197152 RepID=A0A8S1DZM8_9INSE|nr:Hypothetical predicted protein [Cloeon dipterum]
MWMLLLLIFSATNASSRRDKIFQLIIKLQNLTERLDLPELKTSASPTIKPMTAKTNPPGFVNFAKPITFSNSGETKKYCSEAVCPQVSCPLTNVVNFGKLRKSIPLPKIYSMRNRTVKSLISMYKFDFNSALTAVCCTYNSTMLGFTSPELLTIFEDTLKAEKRLKGTYWTAGIFSKECDAYIWCPEMEIIGEKPLMKWKSGFPNREFGDCLAVQTGQEKQSENGLFNLITAARQIIIFATALRKLLETEERRNN